MSIAVVDGVLVTVLVIAGADFDVVRAVLGSTSSFLVKPINPAVIGACSVNLLCKVYSSLAFACMLSSFSASSAAFCVFLSCSLFSFLILSRSS